MKETADLVIDTSGMTVHELRAAVGQHFREPGDPGELAVSIVSFGYKHGIPPVDICFDVRFLANPHFDPRLRPRTGRDPEVARFIEAGELTEPFYRRLLDFVVVVPPELPPREPRVPDGRNRLHRRAPPLRLHRRAAGAGTSSALGYPVRVTHRDEASG